MSAKSQNLSLVLWLLLGIPGLLVLLWFILIGRATPQRIISQILSLRGIEPKTIKFWIAVSAYETNGWTSRVFNDSKNLFCIIVPGSRRLGYGEGQTIYESMKDSVYGLIDHVLKPFNYPDNYSTLDDLIFVMKSKGYFTQNEVTYLSGARQWYNKLFPHG